jgi:replicative DNA helicase
LKPPLKPKPLEELTMHINPIEMSNLQSPQIRIPPNSLEAEMGVLGSLLIDNRTLERAVGQISTKDFYHLSHQLIYQAILDLANDSAPADVITVSERLKAVSQLDSAGGLEYLNRLAQYVPTPSHVVSYANIVREHAILREVIDAGEESSQQAYNREGRSAQQILESFEQRLVSISDKSNGKSSVTSLSALQAKHFEDLQALIDNPGTKTGVQTGLRDLDNMTTGLQAGELVVIAGRPSMGKTSLAMNIAERAAIDQKLAVLVISIEMGGSQLMQRLISSVGRIDLHSLRTGTLKDADWPRFSEANEKLSSAVIDVMDNPNKSFPEIKSIAKSVARQRGGLGLIIVDYIQLMAKSEDSDNVNRATEIGEITRGLKALAKELDCPVLALSQLNRGVETRTDKRPMMSDLRESGAIEQDADIIMLIYRDDYYSKENCKEPGVVEIDIAKQRNGETGKVRLAWQGRYLRFDNL